MSAFYSYVKSTIDKLGVTIAQNFGGGVKFVDLDDSVKTQALLASDDSAIVWELVSMNDDPVPPLYTLNFGIGAKTTLDPGNYNMSDLLDAIRDVIKVRESVDVRDYSPGGDGTTKRGYLYFTDISVDPQLFDKASGIRLISVQAKAVDGG